MNFVPSPDETTVSNRRLALGLNVFTIVTVVLMVLTVWLGLKGRDYFHQFQDYRVEKLTRQASELIDDQRYEQASRMLQDAYRIRQDHPDLNRTLAELFVKGYNDPQTAISFLRRMLNSNESTVADRRRLGELLLQSGDTSEARKLYLELPPAEQTSRRGLELLAGIKRALGEVGEADRILRKALTLVPDDMDARLQLAIMDHAQSFTQARNAAAQSIWEIARRQDDVALKAITFLSQMEELTATQVRELLGILEKNPKATDKHRYQLLQTYVRLIPLERAQVIKQEIARNKGHTPDSMFDFLRWLGLQGEYDTLLKMIPADKIGSDPDVFLIYTDAMSAAERWKELLAMMKKTRKPPVTAATAHVILAHCYARLEPDLQQARRELTELFALNARSEIPIIMRAATLAEEIHMIDLAVQGYMLVSEARPTLRGKMLEKVLQLQQSDNNLEGMIETAKRLREFQPRNQAHRSRLNYLRLVSGTELEEAYEDMIGFDQPAPNNDSLILLPGALLRALAAWRFGDAERMKQEVGKIPDPSKLPAGLRAVVAGLYTLTGRDVDGFRLGENVPQQLLLDAEKRFLRLSLNPG